MGAHLGGGGDWFSPVGLGVEPPRGQLQGQDAWRGAGGACQHPPDQNPKTAAVDPKVAAGDAGRATGRPAGHKYPTPTPKPPNPNPPTLTDLTLTLIL